jgi:hypothetical protein
MRAKLMELVSLGLGCVVFELKEEAAPMVSFQHASGAQYSGLNEFVYLTS